MSYAGDIAIAAAVVCCGPAYGFPENARLGYQTCNSCHVNPGGGGVLTAYGRGFAEELSTYHKENSGALLFGLTPETPDWLLLGGDTRYLDYRTAKAHQDFLMQKDVEIAVRPSKEMTFDVSVGSYYGVDGYQSRRLYAMWTPNDNVDIRVGHFPVVYGLMIPDHTSAIKAPLGYDEGQESYNAELSYRDKNSELFLGATAGDGTAVTAEPAQGSISLQGPSYTARGSYFLTSLVTLGASYALKYDGPHVFEQTVGPFATVAFSPRFYLLAEGDRHVGQGTHFDVSYTELGYEVYRGVHVQLTHEYELANVWGLGFQLFPVSHAEVIAKAKYDGHSGDISSQLLLHIYW